MAYLIQVGDEIYKLTQEQYDDLISVRDDFEKEDDSEYELSDDQFIEKYLHNVPKFKIRNTNLSVS